jgi:hypothetical protein
MIREQTLRARPKLVGKLPISGELLRGSLLERPLTLTSMPSDLAGFSPLTDSRQTVMSINFAPGSS